MSRLDELKAQKREIEAEIKRITQKEVSTERCKFHKEHYGCRKDEWILTYKSKSIMKHEEKNKRLIANPNREQAIQEIDEIINDLREFKEILENTEFADEELS